MVLASDFDADIVMLITEELILQLPVPMKDCGLLCRYELFTVNCDLPTVSRTTDGKDQRPQTTNLFLPFAIRHTTAISHGAYVTQLPSHTRRQKAEVVEFLKLSCFPSTSFRHHSVTLVL